MDPSERIVGHMNHDHQLALADYLVVYAHTTNLDESSPAIVRLDLESFDIEYLEDSKKKTSTIKWTDAKEDSNLDVKEWGDIKNKLVSMAKFAANKRGYSHTRVTKVVLPSWDSAPWYVLATVLALNIYDPNILKNLFANDALFNKIVAYLPDVLTNLYNTLLIKNVRKVALGAYTIHTLEIVFFTIPFFIKHRVPTVQRLQWSLMHLIEGFPVINRLKALAN